MRVAYCSLLLPEEKKLAERSKERLSGISGHKVTVAEIKGIDENIGNPVDIFNIINTLNYPKFPELFFYTEKWNHSNNDEHVDYHLGYINLFGIKYITQYKKTVEYLEKWVRQKNDKCIICVHGIYLPMMMAAINVKRKYSNMVKLCLNAGDVPGNHGLQSQYRKNVKQFLTDHLVNNNVLKLARSFDCFVFVTKDMATAFQVEDKPYVVVECAYTPPTYDAEPILQTSDKKTIFYAGSIRKEYGIDHLLRSFSLIKDENYQLVIAGGGADESLVKEYERKDHRIKFIGFITPQEVLKWQYSSTVLVSPRQSNYDYVKYSFPSKSVDSLASGIPYVAHKLPCDPEEYGQYINYADDESDEALKNKLMEICELPVEERQKIGEEAREFIYREKNPTIMTKSIVNMWEKTWND